MQHIILDTDPGLDDALAIFLALASPEIQLQALTTVCGNVGIEHTTRNALALLEMAGHPEIPVARGCTTPLLRQPITATHVHSENGLGNVVLPEPARQPIAQHAVDLLIEQIMREPDRITLVAIGPLTNLALAVRREPRITRYVHEVVIMGGALRVPGNVTPTAEFNIYADPEAAQIVLQAGWPLRLVSLDVTTRTLLSHAQIDGLARLGGNVHRFIGEALHYYLYESGFGTNGLQMHDPLCLAASFQPDLITWQKSYVAVELAGTLTSGTTVAYHGRSDAPPGKENAQVSVDVDVERFLALFCERVGNAFH